MEIRTYEAADQDVVIALWTRCDLIRPWNDPRKDIGRKLAVHDDLFLVGLIDEPLVATVMAGYEGHRGWVNYLAVDPLRRREGLARMLMGEAERRLADRDCPKINLQVRSSNSDALGFYERLGYSDDKVVSLGKRLESDSDS